MAGGDAVEVFNRGCRCISVDEAALHRALAADLAEAGLPRPLVESHPHLFAELPVFLSRDHIERMRAVVRSVEAVARLAGHREQVRAWAPPIAGFEPRALSVFFGYDFHLAPGAEAGPQLIEINTNAGGALLNTYLARAQQACCAEVAAGLVGPADPDAVERALVAMFRNEWQREHPDRPLRRIAIVDDAPREQALYPEFVLFERLFARHGIEAVVADARALYFEGGVLRADGAAVDLVYNRLCDFYLEEPGHAALRDAYLARAAVVTPHPHAYATVADKRNLVVFSDAEALGALGAAPDDVATLAAGVPATVRVTPGNADALWRERRRLFFKPVSSFGSRGAYRGAKLTRRVWESILAEDYVAQQLVQPGEREVMVDEAAVPLKVDLRAFVYDGEIQLLAARMYQGQTTNLRTPGGGFAPVFTEARP